MRKSFCVLALACFCAVIFLPGLSAAEVKEFDGGRYNLKGNLWTIQELSGKLNADEYPDTVNLIVQYDAANAKAERVWFEVQLGYSVNTPDRKKPKPFLVPLPEAVQGYNLEAQLRSFIPGEQEQVFMTLDEAPNGPRLFAVIQLRVDDVRRDARFLFDSRTMNRAILSGSFVGKYLASLRVEDTGMNVFLDLSGKKAFYENLGVYDRRGKILKPVAVAAKKYDAIALGERDARGISELLATVELFGASDDDHIATVVCALRYDPDFASWKVAGSRIAPAPGVKIAEERSK